MIPGCVADASDVSGDLVTEVAAIRAGMPGRDSEGFVKPTFTELAQWQTLIAALWERQWTTASNLVATNFPSYELVRFTDTGFSNRVYYLLREKLPVTKGWGSVIINPQFERDLAIEAPHPVYDTGTSTESADVFRRTGARLFLLAGTHRCANAEVSPCDGTGTACTDGRYHVSDMAHYMATCFQTTHELATVNSASLYSISVHGHSSTSCPDVFLSNGHGTDTTPLLGAIKASVLAAGSLTVAESGDGSSDCP